MISTLVSAIITSYCIRTSIHTLTVSSLSQVVYSTTRAYPQPCASTSSPHRSRCGWTSSPYATSQKAKRQVSRQAFSAWRPLIDHSLSCPADRSRSHTWTPHSRTRHDRTHSVRTTVSHAAVGSVFSRLPLVLPPLHLHASIPKRQATRSLI